MSANFTVANSPCFLDGTAGNAGAVGSGGYTIAILFRPAAGNNGASMVQGRASGSAVRTLLEDSLHLFGENDFSSGDAVTLVQGNWYVAAQTKAPGSNTYRHHLWQYNSSGAGTMIHAVSSGSANHGDGATLDTIRIGGGPTVSNCEVAVVGLWDTNLADGSLDLLKSSQLLAWANLSPDELVTFEDWNGTTGWSTRIGTSALTAESGTVTVGADPPDFSFDLASTVDLTPATFSFSAVTTTPVPGAVTVNLTPAGMTFSAPTVTPVAGSVVTLTPAGFVFSASAVTPLSASVVNLTSATMAFGAVPVSAVPGLVSVNLTSAMINFMGGSVTPFSADTGDDISVCLGTPELAWTLGTAELAWMVDTPELAWTLASVEVDC